MSNIPSSLATFDRTIALNNAGATLMDQEDYTSAIKILERAFFTFKKAYRLRRDNLVSNRTQQSHFTNVDDLFSWKRRRVCTTAGLEKENDPVEPASTLSIYSNAIHLPQDFPVTIESCGFLSTAIALNLAMSHHLVALAELHKTDEATTSAAASSNMRKHERTQAHLDAAGRLYEYTIRLESTRARQHQQQQQQRGQENEHLVTPSIDPVVAMSPPTTSRLESTASISSSIDSSSSTISIGTSNTVPTLFVSPFALMVILNNSGHVYEILQQQQKSERYYLRLQSACMYMMMRQRQHQRQQQYGQGGIFGSISADDLQVFLHNVNIGLDLIHCHSAPAA